jgi:large subunit ribosomal protein L15
MVLRKAKKNRKFFGTRRWGVGNIKNARGAGGRGGVGDIGRLRKHDFTYITAKAPWMLRKKGFTPINRKKLKEITLRQINGMLMASKEPKATLEFRNYKVLSNGEIEKPAIIKASGFSKSAAEKIKSAGGEIVVLANEGAQVKEKQATT